MASSGLRYGLAQTRLEQTLNDIELKRKRLAEIRAKIDRGLKQLDEGLGISAEDARIRLRLNRRAANSSADDPAW